MFSIAFSTRVSVKRCGWILAWELMAWAGWRLGRSGRGRIEREMNRGGKGEREIFREREADRERGIGKERDGREEKKRERERGHARTGDLWSGASAPRTEVSYSVFNKRRDIITHTHLFAGVPAAKL